MNKKTIILFIIGSVFLAGIIGGIWWYLQEPSLKEKCGDGICGEVEKQKGICPEDCEPTDETETCGLDNNGYCIDFREKCKTGYQGIGPDKCSAGRSAECCVPN